MSEIEELKKSIQTTEEQFSKIEDQIKQMRESLQIQFKSLLDKHQLSQIDTEFLESFFDEP